MFFKECPFLIPSSFPAFLQDIFILDKEYHLDVGRPIITVPMTTLPARWWTNHHVSSSSTRKLDTGHWPMLAVVWAMSPAPKMKEASAASHDLYSVRCAYQFREIHSHPQDQVTESVHLFTVERRVSIIYSHTVVYSQIFSVLIHRNCCGRVGSWYNDCKLSTFFLLSQLWSSFLVRIRRLDTTNRLS